MVAAQGLELGDKLALEPREQGDLLLALEPREQGSLLLVGGQKHLPRRLPRCVPTHHSSVMAATRADQPMRFAEGGRHWGRRG